jgi:two-component system, cell cycle sensor histidine kinase and response regulator CckA
MAGEDSGPVLGDSPMAEHDSGAMNPAADPAEYGHADAVSALSAGLAHDLNNVLSAVLMMVDLLGESCTRDRERNVLAALEESARRGIALGRQLRWLAGGAEEEVALFQPKYLLIDLQKIAHTLFPASITVASRFSPDLLLLKGDPLKVYGLLLGLCLDARQALPEAGGELHLAAWNEELDEIASTLRPGSSAGPHVVLEVARSAGEGPIPATVVAAAAACGGFAEAVPRTGGGQAFRVYLPAVGMEDPKSLVAELREGDGELILVVEGDTAVREAMAGVLEGRGYRVETGADGVEAIALFARDAQAIAAVVVAADLAYLDGPGTLRAFRRLRDGVPAVLTGGDDELAAHAALACSCAPVVLGKPFTGTALLGAVRQALGR